MPRARPKGGLEGSAVADLFKHTLSRIPTVYGQLSYLASLRDLNSGIYRHHGLFVTFGREESVQALQSSHEGVFRDWLAMPLEGKYEDLSAYLASLDDPKTKVFQHWKQSRIYRTCIPQQATEAETELFLYELEVLLDL